MTVILLLLLVVLLGGGYAGNRAYGPRGLLGAVVLVLVIVLIVWLIRDEAAVGPGVPSIIQP
ncbi:MAG TPA: hypothetical protein VLA00_09405 [Xanthobacteraceae bacterium]|nr:hypothetical protein [Xanthobacteraceae bacterium]